jgi:parallel beta-helix repeat protein
MKASLHFNTAKNYLNAGLTFAVILIITATFTSCKKEISTKNDQPVTAAKNGKSPDIIVHAGESIQSAVDAASEGFIIRIEAGTYKEAIVINKPGIQLIGSGAEEVIIDNPGDAENGITVRDDGDGFVLKNVTIQNFEENGVFIIRADNFLLSHVITKNDGEYGLFPLFCNGGTIEHCSAEGHTDTGIYVGQSENVVMEHNVAFANVNGLEIENCSNVTASKNQAYDNVCGILVVLLPGLTIKQSADITLSNNHVYGNNHINFANPEEGFEAFVPSGSGILVVGVDRTTATNNKIGDNNFLGLAVVSSLNLGALAGLPPEAFADIEPNADGSKIIDNKLENNGTVQPAIPLPAVDLLWDGTGTNNCWSDNIFSTSFPSPLPACD